MSVASKNPFQLLGDDGSEASSAPSAPQTKQTQNAPSKPRNVPGAGRSSAPKSSGGDAPATDEGPVMRDSRARNGPRGSERGRGRGRPQRGRQFDRHSAMDHQDSSKAVEQGWGGTDPEVELRQEQGAAQDARKEQVEERGENAAAQRTEEPEDRTLTLEEYLKAKEEKRAAVGAAAAPGRTVAEDESYGQKLVRTGGEDYFAGMHPKAHTSAQQRPKKEGKITLEFEPRYDAPSAPRGGRGGGRGGRGGPGGRGGSASSTGPVVNLNDESAFPSLG